MSPENVDVLLKQIQASGAPDRYIDRGEEAAIFEKGRGLGIPKTTVESLLNQVCRANQWTREGEILQDLHDQLEEATKDDGVISQQEFEHCVNYGVAMNMPRRRAMELSVEYVLDKGLSIKKGFLGKDWFKPLRGRVR